MAFQRGLKGDVLIRELDPELSSADVLLTYGRVVPEERVSTMRDAWPVETGTVQMSCGEVRVSKILGCFW